MKNFGFFIITAGLLVFLLWSQLQLAGRPVQDNDEGIYLTTFLLMDRGYPAYKDTYLSQPPFFVIAAYPLFEIFGKTLQSARFIVGFWSVIGLLAALWIGRELGKKWLGLLCIGILYLIPRYTNQTLVFQSDIIVSTFSLLALASFIRFMRANHILWFVASALFVNMAFWTKFDLTLIPGLIWGTAHIAHICKVSKLRLAGIFITVSILFLAVCIAPFGLRYIYENAVLLRLQAASATPASFRLFELMLSEPVLLIVVAFSIIIPFLNANMLKPALRILVIWNYSTLLFFFFYRPLFPHHLTIVGIPAALLVSCFLSDLLDKAGRIQLRIFPVACLLITAVWLRIGLVSRLPGANILDHNQAKAINCILINTKPGDLVVSDEGILTAVSGRLPPPALADISYVRINSGNLTASQFKNMLAKYRPRMVISWNGRLATFKNLNGMLGDYSETPCMGKNINRHLYIRHRY